MKKESMTLKKTWVHKHFFQNTIQKKSKMVLDIPKEVEGVHKIQEEDKQVDLEEEVEAISTGRLDEANQSTNSTNNGNPKPKFDKTKVKCYDYEKMNHYARDC